MTLEREVSAGLRTMLMSGAEFEYAHLIKFERPSRPDASSGLVSTSAVRYTYLTDASRNIDFDDGSKTRSGVLNGTQVYQANKVLKVSEVSESVEAKATNFTITLDGNGLGAQLALQNIIITNPSVGIYDLEIVDKTIDPTYEGFREGDKIELYGAQAGYFNIVNFRSNNVIRVSKIDTNLTAATSAIGVRLTSEEIKSILLDKNASEYSSFINREVFIYRIYQQSGVTIGSPILLFKGIISNVSFDDGDGGIKVSWGLTSHWGDFLQVKGRITSDDFHRALDQNGNPQPASTLKPEYAYDKGFTHSETSINLLAKYIVQVEKTKIKAKNGLFGIGAKTKVKKYLVPEDRFSQLDFQLAARSIPLHYGVRLTEGFPIFADTLNTDSSEVYVVYALGEGPVGGIYDILIDGRSLICNDKGDFDARSVQTADDTVDIVCRGRADRGDVLGGSPSVGPIVTDYYTDTQTTTNPYANNSSASIFSRIIAAYRANNYVPPASIGTYSSTGKGIIDGESISLDSPIKMTLDFFNGSSNQKASPQLMALAKAGQFKIQNDYWIGPDSADYWGPNHRLLDTAYIVAKFKIAEGETTIPSLEFILRSKVLPCYNYDYSYTHYTKSVGESEANFALGSTVDLRRSDTDAIINASVKIIDKWDFVQSDGSIETRFRYSATPLLGYTDGIPTITKFYMQQGANKWTMTTFNYVETFGIMDYELITDSTVVTDPGGAAIPLPVPMTIGNPAPLISGVNSTSVLVSGTLDSGTLRTGYSLVKVQAL